MSRKAKRARKNTTKRETAQAEKRAAVSSVPASSQALAEPSPGISRYTWLFLSLLLIWSFLISCFPMRNMDIWWHLRTGELILERGTVPYFDWFTFVDSDRPWIDMHWGFQLLVTWLYQWGGVDLLILSKAFCLALTVGLGWFAGGRFLPPWGKALLWILPVICLSGRSVVRPEMLSLVYLAAWMLVLNRAAARPPLLWLIPLLAFLWVNSHALFVLGLVVSVLWVIDHLVRGWARGRFGLEPAATELTGVMLIRIAVLTGIACFLNPYFEQGVLFPLTLYEKFSVDQAFYSVRIGEFQPPLDFIRQHGLKNLFLASQVLLGVLTLVSFIPLLINRRINVFRLLLFAAFTHLAFKASRNTSIFALISGIVLCDNLSDWSRFGIALFGKPASDTAEGSHPLSRGSLVSAGIFLFLFISLFTGYWHAWGGEGKRLALGEAEAWYAHGASKFAGQPGMPDRAYISNMGQAAVYIYHNGPEKRVFFDGRLEVNSQQTFEWYEQIKQQMMQGSTDWAYLLQDEKGQLPAVILDSRYSRNEIMGMAANPGWMLVFADQAAAVFLDRQTAERLKLQPADPSPLAYPPGMKVRE
ncbi:hypothetical protein V6x_03850 [Gimesia chilikensis]|uniref:Uncharacterized protein n=1 Tax=Gimesia chilikensis TaxID=2605989 RepID=A0A517W643_9PLAN|nr:hypothetical protein [Gimesia chilikensis]QDU00709.1 hypothetical protein V6x_03850 [Gimesia chilikensis]